MGSYLQKHMDVGFRSTCLDSTVVMQDSSTIVDASLRIKIMKELGCMKMRK